MSELRMRWRPLGWALAAVFGACIAQPISSRFAGLPLDASAQARFSRPPAKASAFSEPDIRTWLTYLASDELQGRQTFTEGLGLAGAYIARHLEQFGVSPGGDNNTYFQTVRVHGVRTRSNSRVTVTVNGESRTFKDGEGVTFPREQGGKRTVGGRAELVGYGLRYTPLSLDDYKGRDVAGKVVLYVGSKGPAGLGTAETRLLGSRGRMAVEDLGAAASIGPAATPQAQPTAAPGQANARQIDFQSARRLDATAPPQITAGDDFFAFVLSASGHSYADVKAATERQEPIPAISLGDVTISVTVDAEYDIVQTRLTRNVVGIVRGKDARLADTYVMFGAHYDHVGYEQFSVPAGSNQGFAACTGQTRPTPRPGDIINNGADDDGSGTVGLMAIARAFASGPRPRRSVVFVWHTGEESGLQGSRYMADHPVVPLDRVAAQLNIDMIGRNRCDDPAEANRVYLVGSDRISTDLHNTNEDANASLATPLSLNYEFNDVADPESFYTRSDHYSYAAKGVPIAFFFTGVHRDYHYVTDEVDKILFDKLGRIAQLVYTSGWQLANADRAPGRDRLGPRMGKGQTGRIGAPTPGAAGARQHER